MKEILFKAKRIDNGEWVQGFLFKMQMDGGYTWCIGEEPLTANDYSEIIGCGRTWFFINHHTLCQYTGLTDNNLNEIWENDVVRCIDYNSGASFMAVVEFGNPNSFYSWGYQFRYIKGDTPNLDILLWIDAEETGAICEVIGNTFDNPDLLKGE